DLGDVGPGGEEVAGAVGGDDVAGCDRDASTGAALVRVTGGDDQRQRLEHLLLVTVRGVDHDHVDTGGQQRVGLGAHVAVDADGCAHREPTVRVDGGRVDRGAQRPGASDDTGEHATVEHGCDRDVRTGEGVEVVARLAPGVN